MGSRKIKDKVIEICKVKGVDNLADALAKYVDGTDIEKHLRGISCDIGIGRHSIMPEIEDIHDLKDDVNFQYENTSEQGDLSDLTIQGSINVLAPGPSLNLNLLCQNSDQASRSDMDLKRPYVGKVPTVEDLKQYEDSDSPCLPTISSKEEWANRQVKLEVDTSLEDMVSHTRRMLNYARINFIDSTREIF